MLVVGLTGSIGSGKSTVADLFAEKGAPVIDADIIARQITQTGSSAYNAIVDRFGKKILLDDDSLDRRQLREIIFQDPHHKKWLEELLHPIIMRQIADEITYITHPYCIAVIPLLMEIGADAFIDHILVIDVNEEDQLQRASLRDNSTTESIKAILKTQMTRDERLKIADDIIDNSGSIDALDSQVEKLHQKYLQLGQGK